MKELSKRNNTLIVVEHDENTILHADLIVELGPGGGKEGGYLITTSSSKQLLKDKNQLQQNT